MTNTCVKLIYVDRWHRRACGKPAKKGDYCGIHDPDKKAARQAKKQAQWDAEEAANDERRVGAALLISNLGMGTSHYKNGWTGNIILTPQEVEEVLSWKTEAQREAEAEERRELEAPHG